MSKYNRITKNIEELLIDNPKTKRAKISWTNINNPGKEELDYLRKKYGFSLKHLQTSSAKTIAHRPMIYQEDGYLFLILHFPVIKGNTIISGEIEFFIGHGFLITLHNDIVKPLNLFFNSCKKNEGTLLSYNLESSAILLYEILEKLMLESYNLLDQNSVIINEVETTIFSRKQRKANSDILALRRNILNLRKIIQNHKNILKKLMEMKSTIVPEKEIKSHYYILLEHSKRIWEHSEIQKETIDALYDTNESILNFRLNEIMKALTIFSIVLLPLTLIASIFGMNTQKSMPFVSETNGFSIILSMMGISAILIILFLIKKKWL
jgi:magnesium transporter